jgi:hypothetical protein
MLLPAQHAHAADRLIEYPIVAGLGSASFQFLLGTLYHPAAAYAAAVGLPTSRECYEFFLWPDK